MDSKMSFMTHTIILCISEKEKKCYKLNYDTIPYDDSV